MKNNFCSAVSKTGFLHQYFCLFQIFLLFSSSKFTFSKVGSSKKNSSFEIQI